MSYPMYTFIIAIQVVEPLGMLPPREAERGEAEPPPPSSGPLSAQIACFVYATWNAASTYIVSRSSSACSACDQVQLWGGSLCLCPPWERLLAAPPGPHT